MEFGEISLRSQVAFESLCGLLAFAFSVERELVGEENEYWDRFGTDHPLVIGVEVGWSDLGYMTFLKWIQETEVSGPQLLNIAMKAARQFDTEVAIGDIFAPEEDKSGRFLVANGNGDVYQAIEVSNGEVFEVALNSSPINPIEVQKLLSQPGPS